MPSKTVELAVLDTSIYIANFRTGRFTARIAESPFLFRGVSVVIVPTARSIGATVITLNGQDFEDIRLYRRFRLICWE